MIQTDAAPTAQLHKVLESFFETKTACDVEGTMAYFAPEMVCYVDATPGWDFDSYAALKTVRHYADALLRRRRLPPTDTTPRGCVKTHPPTTGPPVQRS